MSWHLVKHRDDFIFTFTVILTRRFSLYDEQLQRYERTFLQECDVRLVFEWYLDVNRNTGYPAVFVVLFSPNSLLRRP